MESQLLTKITLNLTSADYALNLYFHMNYNICILHTFLTQNIYRYFLQEN